MKATAKLQELGQSLWLDNITREMLNSGQLQRYVEEFSITGLTSDPSILESQGTRTEAGDRTPCSSGPSAHAQRRADWPEPQGPQIRKHPQPHTPAADSRRRADRAGPQATAGG